MSSVSVSASTSTNFVSPGLGSAGNSSPGMPGTLKRTFPQRISAAWFGPTLSVSSPSGRLFAMSNSVRAETATVPPLLTFASAVALMAR